MRSYSLMIPVLFGVQFLAHDQTASAAAPKVVRTNPANGDNNVDPSIKVILVEFDQDMEPSGFSWTGGPPTFPKTNGTPQWSTPRTCELLVILEPGKEYKFGVNGPSHKNFRNKAGEPAEPVEVTFRTRGADGKPMEEKKLTAEINQNAIDELRKKIDGNYSYRDLRKVDWAKQFADHKEKLLAATTSEQFAKEAAELLKPAGDIHIWIELANGQRIATTTRSVVPNISRDALLKELPGLTRPGDGLATGRFDDGIGYLNIATWETTTFKDATPIVDALRTLEGTKGLIIDVRTNSGGDELIAQFIAGCFVDSPMPYAKHSIRDPSQADGWQPLKTRNVKPSDLAPAYRKRVAVLMGKANMSSCEAFLLMMRQYGNCKLFGETSYGSSGNPQPYNLGNGVTVFLPSWKALTLDGTLIEGNGIKPDVVVPTKAEDFKDKDPVLDAALTWLRTK